MGVVTRAKKRMLEEEERGPDRISSLPDDILGDIVSFLSTKDGCRTQVLSSRWCHLWRRFSPTLRVASFRECRFRNVDIGGALRPWPLLKQLTLSNVIISERSMHALLAGCPVLESLLLVHNTGFRRLRIVSSSLRSIGVHSSALTLPNQVPERLKRLIIEDAPCLERLLYFGGIYMNITVISAPVLAILGKGFPRIQFGATFFQGPNDASMSCMVRSMKILALYSGTLFMDDAMNLLEYFPQLEKLYIKITMFAGNGWSTFQKHISTVDLGLKKIVLRNYRGNKADINLAELFLSNGRVLESMRFELGVTNVSAKWIQQQHKLFQTVKRASRCVEFDFVSPNMLIGSLDNRRAEQVHDLSADPFERFH